MASSSTWTQEQDKLFGDALVTYPEDTPDRRDKIAQACGKTVEEVKKHYEILEEEINAIQASLVDLSGYMSDEGEKSKARGSKAPSNSKRKK